MSAGSTSGCTAPRPRASASPARAVAAGPGLATAEAIGAKVVLVDEAHFHADADPRGTWGLEGAPAPVDSTGPRRGEQASDYAAACLETGEVEATDLDGASDAETSTAFPRHLRAHHPGPLIVIRDDGPAHGGAALRAYLATPDLRLCLVRKPGPRRSPPSRPLSTRTLSMETPPWFWFRRD